MAENLNIGEDMNVFWPVVRSGDAAPVITGTFTATLKDAAEVIVSGASALPMVFQTTEYLSDAPNGSWLVTIPGSVTATLTSGTRYWLYPSGTSGAGQKAFRRIECVAMKRGER